MACNCVVFSVCASSFILMYYWETFLFTTRKAFNFSCHLEYQPDTMMYRIGIELEYTCKHLFFRLSPDYRSYPFNSGSSRCWRDEDRGCWHKRRRRNKRRRRGRGGWRRRRWRINECKSNASASRYEVPTKWSRLWTFQKELQLIRAILSGPFRVQICRTWLYLLENFRPFVWKNLVFSIIDICCVLIFRNVYRFWWRWIWRWGLWMIHLQYSSRRKGEENAKSDKPALQFEDQCCMHSTINHVLRSLNRAMKFCGFKDIKSQPQDETDRIET